MHVLFCDIFVLILTQASEGAVCATEGSRLSIWVQNQRMHYAQGRLDLDRIARLEQVT